MSRMTTFFQQEDLLLESINLTQMVWSEISSILENQSKAISHQRSLELTMLSLKLSQFVELTSLLTRYMLRDHEQLKIKIKENHIQLLYLMKAVHQAFSAGDEIAMEELINYELRDNLTQWKIDLLPQLKMKLRR